MGKLIVTAVLLWGLVAWAAVRAPTPEPRSDAPAAERAGCPGMV